MRAAQGRGSGDRQHQGDAADFAAWASSHAV